MTIADRLAAVIPAAAARARATERHVLASAAERLPLLDPLDVVTSPDAESYDRMYWARPAAGFALAGIGAVVDYTPSGAARFGVIDEAWRALLDDALVDGAPAEGTAGVGPLLMGGFAFDPAGPRTEHWRDFPAAALALPRLQIARRRDVCWLTANVLVSPDGSADVAPGDVARLWDALRDDGRDNRDGDRGMSRSGPAEDAPLYADARSPVAWRALVQRAVEAIRAGEMEKVVLAREVRGSVPGDLDVGETLRYLREVHPTCSVFACWRGSSVFLGATPEMLVQLQGSEVRTGALAGSVRRGARGDDDHSLAHDLMTSAKDRAEHEVVRRWLCAALGELCTHVTAARVPSILTLANVHHLYTSVVATLRDGGSLLQLVARLHPTPAVGGEPRDAALRFIREHEELDRGWYAAPIGWLQGDRGEFGVALRSALLADGEASLFAGCGIVAASDPEREYVESVIKLRPMKLAFAASLEPSASDDDTDVESLASERAS